MASPFSVFRRNQRILLAACAILAMVAFVFLDPLLSYFGQGSRGGAGNPVVVQWKQQGDIREAQLMYMMGIAAATNDFLMMAYNTALATGASPEAPRLVVHPVSEAAVVEIALLASYAQGLGFVVSDDVVNQYLRRITADGVNAEQFDDILRRLSVGNRRVSMQNIFDELKRRMLWNQMGKLSHSWNYGVPPGERWEYFLKLHQQAVIDAVPVSTASMVAQVREPTPEEVQAFYDRYGKVVNRPVVVSGKPLAPPTPGFSRPPRAQFQYFKANFNEFVEVAKAQITEQEIEKFYNENKALFPAGSSFFDDPEASPEGEGQTPNDTPIGVPDEPQGPAAIDPFSPAGGAKSATEQPAAGQERQAPPTAPATETRPAIPATPPSTPTAPPAEPPQPGPSDQGSMRSRPAGLLEAALPAVALAALQAEAPAAGRAAAAAPDGPEAPPPSVPAEPAPSASGASSASSLGSAVSPPPLIADPAAAADRPENYAPLEKVRENIRNRLARQQAAREIGQIFDRLEEVLNNYASRHLVWQSAQQAGEKASPQPTPPNFEELASQFGVAAVTLPAMSLFDLDRETDVGKSYEMRITEGIAVPGQRLLNLAFGSSYPLYRPLRTQDDEQDQYLVWKTAFVGEYTPPLDQIRDEVVQAWKLIEARELVRRRAEQLAELARQDSSQPLRQTLGAQPGIEVIETQPFAWMTQGSAASDLSPQPARLSPVPELSNIGPEFMQKVFSMKVGEIGVAWNYPQSVMYVFQLKELTSLDLLHSRFVSYSFDRYAGAGSEIADQVRSGWLFRITNANGLRWLRQAKQPQAR